MDHLDKKIDPIVADLNSLISDADASLKQARRTMLTVEEDAKEVFTSAQKTLESAQSALKQSEKTLSTFSDDSRLVYEMTKTLKELSAAAHSVRILSDYLERHPEALLRGKPVNEGE